LEILAVKYDSKKVHIVLNSLGVVKTLTMRVYDRDEHHIDGSFCVAVDSQIDADLVLDQNFNQRR